MLREVADAKLLHYAAHLVCPHLWSSKYLWWFPISTGDLRASHPAKHQVTLPPTEVNKVKVFYVYISKKIWKELIPFYFWFQSLMIKNVFWSFCFLYISFNFDSKAKGGFSNNYNHGWLTLFQLLSHMIYCFSDKSYSCLVGIGLGPLFKKL